MEVKLTELGGRVNTLETQMCTLESRVDKHGQELDEYKMTLAKMQGSMDLIKKDIEIILRTSQKTEDKIDSLNTARLNEHYIEPIHRNREMIQKTMFAIISLTIGFFFKVFVDLF